MNKKGSSVLSRFDYTYDANGNIITVNDGSATKTYVYDKLNRLIEIQPAVGNKTIYTYDLRGNRLTKSSNHFEFDLVNTSYSYDMKNILSSVTKGTEITIMEYYADGLRGEKTTATDFALKAAVATGSALEVTAVQFRIGSNCSNRSCFKSSSIRYHFVCQ